MYLTSVWPVDFVYVFQEMVLSIEKETFFKICHGNLSVVGHVK